MSIPAAVTTPVTALLAEAERDRSGTDGVSVTCKDRAEDSTQLWRVYLLFVKIRLVSNVHHS